MIQKDIQIAKLLKKKLSAIVNLIDFRIFGSRARGDMDEYSDMDVFIEIPYLDKDLKEQIFDISWEIGFEYSRVISVLIFTKDKFEKALKRESPIVINILHEGVAI